MPWKDFIIKLTSHEVIHHVPTFQDEVKGLVQNIGLLYALTQSSFCY